MKIEEIILKIKNIEETQEGLENLIRESEEKNSRNQVEYYRIIVEKIKEIAMTSKNTKDQVENVLEKETENMINEISLKLDEDLKGKLDLFKKNMNEVKDEIFSSIESIEEKSSNVEVNFDETTVYKISKLTKTIIEGDLQKYINKKLNTKKNENSTFKIIFITTMISITFTFSLLYILLNKFPGLII